ILLYRKNAADDWHEYPHYIKHNLGSSSVMYGYVQLDTLFLGEYTFANGVSHVLGIDEHASLQESMKVFPNPSSNSFTVKFTAANADETLYIYDTRGKIIKQFKLKKGEESLIINTSNWSNGTYLISLHNSVKQIATTQVVIAH